MSMTFYRKPRQDPTMGSCISKPLCSTASKIHNTVYTQCVKGHDILGKKGPQKFSSYLNLVKFDQHVAK